MLIFSNDLTKLLSTLCCGGPCKCILLTIDSNRRVYQLDQLVPYPKVIVKIFNPDAKENTIFPKSDLAALTVIQIDGTDNVGPRVEII